MTNMLARTPARIPEKGALRLRCWSAGFVSRRLLLALLLGSSLASACATRRPGDPIRPGFNVYSPEQDVELGRQAAAEIRQQLDIADDPQLQAYVDEIGRKLASQPEAGGFPYSFTLVNDKEINAFALPGGPTFVHTGLIAAADNEAQLAGVLAHEISHVALRHGTAQASKATLIQIPAVLGGAAIGDSSVLAQLAQLGLGLGVNSVIMKYSRDAENEADALGARIMAGAGYNPVEMASFFEKLEQQGGPRPPQFLSSHPNPGNRMASVQAEIATLPEREYQVASAPQFQQMKERVAQLPEPRPRTELARQASPPAGISSGGLQTLDTDALSIGYPSGWQAFGDRQAAVVTLAPREGLVQTQDGRTAIGFGVVLSYYRPQEQQSSLQGATRELISQLGSVNPNLRAAQRQQQLSVDGSQALLTTLQGTSPYGGRETDLLLTVARPEGLFYLVFVVPQDHVSGAEQLFEQMVNTLRFRG